MWHNPTDEIAAPPGLKLCLKFAEHVGNLMKEKTGQGPLVPFLKGVPLPIQAEMQTLVDVVHSAWANPVELAFSLDELASASKEPLKGVKRSDHLLQKFPPPDDVTGRLLDSPMVFIDNEGKAIAWYLPGLWTTRRRHQVFHVVEDASHLPNSIINMKGAENWRTQASGFANPDTCKIKPGCVNIVSSWYNQGQGPPLQVPAPSASLNPKNGTGGLGLLRGLEELNALTGALLYLVNPLLFNMQMQVLLELSTGRAETADDDLTQAVMEIPAEVVQWVNRNFPKPRVDHDWLQGCYEWAIGLDGVRPNSQELFDTIRTQLLKSSLSQSLDPTDGLPQDIGDFNTQVTLCGVPTLVEIISLSEVGSSAFQLDQVRKGREERLRAGGFDEYDEGDEEADLEVEGEGPLPKYPRSMLSFVLSDGTTQFQAMEYKPLPQLSLVQTPLGFKLQLKAVRFICGVAYLEPDNVILLGGDSDLNQRKDYHFRQNLRKRMGFPNEPMPEFEDGEGKNNEHGGAGAPGPPAPHHE
ncbi:hypothetical protein D9611_011252 [Ephemerocybe angulata]|uniref:RecQ-mediated genome instability protein 1 n=1 Tax=Ephemerocybe angulata TaxID=980116 RepID=A0A8H5FJX2_9AGAR|nr:hypothetical protein D9611_011252 [Tulosesus angulatus]